MVNDMVVVAMMVQAVDKEIASPPFSPADETPQDLNSMHVFFQDCEVTL